MPAELVRRYPRQLVIVYAIINIEGKMEQMVVKDSPDARLNEPVLKALRKNGLSVVAMHNHMTGTSPQVYFLHYWGKGPAATLATGFKAALDQTGKGGPQTSSLKH